MIETTVLIFFDLSSSDSIIELILCYWSLSSNSPTIKVSKSTCFIIPVISMVGIIRFLERLTQNLNTFK